MPKYSVILEGKNFPIKAAGRTNLFGFYTTRKVKAVDPVEAEMLAVELVRKDAKLIQVIDKEAEIEPEVYLESISKLPWWKKTGGTGYSFFSMEDK